MSSKWVKYHGSENELQTTVARYLDSLGVLYCHVANERNTHKARGAMLKRMGVKRGVPDLLIFEPRGEKIGLAIELKVGYNKPSEFQKDWLMKLSLRGWSCHWTNSLDEAIFIIENYFKQPIKK